MRLPNTSGRTLNDTRAPIAILGPMDCEFNFLSTVVDNRKEVKYGSYLFVEGIISGYPVVIIRSLVGMANAAAATTLAIDNYNPLCVIVQGTAGGHNPERFQGDIILGKDIIELGTCFSEHRDAGEGSDYTKWLYPGEEMLQPDGSVVRVKTLHSNQELLDIAKEVPYSHGKLVEGVIGSADAWNREIDKINFYHDVLGSDCEEMEGFAVAQICNQFNIPALILRIVSNSELHPEEEFSKMFGVYSQEYTLKIVEQIIKKYK